LLSLLIPILVSFLKNESTIKTVSKSSELLHDEALQRITNIGPRYPEQFRTIMNSQTDLKAKLGDAVKLNQASTKAAIAAANAVKMAPSQPAKPTITLKTNFSFSG